MKFIIMMLLEYVYECGSCTLKSCASWGKDVEKCVYPPHAQLRPISDTENWRLWVGPRDLHVKILQDEVENMPFSEIGRGYRCLTAL